MATHGAECRGSNSDIPVVGQIAAPKPFATFVARMRIAA